MKRLLHIVVLLCVFTGALAGLQAQTPVPPPMTAYQPLGGDQLDQLLGPIALYPDPLIAEILPASTFPEQIVLADRYLASGGDPGQIDQQSWDASIQALVRYPDLLKWLDDNLSWTTELGQAFLNQPQDVMDSIQRLRQSALNYGNLQSTPQEQVVTDDGYIQIVPADPSVIYVPVYQPGVVYDQTSYGTPFVTFSAGWPVGAWLNCDFDWHNHNIIVWNHDHPRPTNWWHQPPRDRDHGHVTIWHSDNHTGAIRVPHGDRGWNITNNRPNNRPVVTTIGQSRTPMPVARPAAPANRPAGSFTHTEPAPSQQRQPANNVTFIGGPNSHDTKDASDRGRQSLQLPPRSAPVTHSAPASHPSGGGGGHSSQVKH